jgi:hypothetical protein
MKQMSWRGPVGRKELYLKAYAGDTWTHYRKSKFGVPDYREAKGSLGYATMQALIKRGWSIVPDTSANTLEDDSSALLSTTDLEEIMSSIPIGFSDE